MKTLLKLQGLDLKIEACKALEGEIPKKKRKFEIHKQRLAQELAESDKRCKDLVLEQRACESDIETRKADIARKEQQLLAVKKNEEYQALLHEIDMQKKQIALKEERIIAIMVETDEAKARLEEDKKRIERELAGIEAECAKIDKELVEAVARRSELEVQCEPLRAQIDKRLLSQYGRIRKAKKTGKAVVPLNDETCSGCHMSVTAQVVNEVLAGDKVHSCSHCGRLLFAPENFVEEGSGTA